MKKKLLFLFTSLLTIAHSAWATDYFVNNEADLRTAVEDNSANITMLQDIILTATLEIPTNLTIYLNINI